MAQEQKGSELFFLVRSHEPHQRHPRWLFQIRLGSRILLECSQGTTTTKKNPSRTCVLLQTAWLIGTQDCPAAKFLCGLGKEWSSSRDGVTGCGHLISPEQETARSTGTHPALSSNLFAHRLCWKIASSRPVNKNHPRRAHRQHLLNERWMLNYSLCAIGAAALEEGGRFRVVLSVLEHFILRALRLPSATEFTTRNGGESRQRF